MAKILKFNDHSNNIDMVQAIFDKMFDGSCNESNSEYDESLVKSMLKHLSQDIKFNIGLVFTFGTGIALMIPIVENLIKNSNLQVDLTFENLVLLTLTVVAITYLEEVQNKQGDDVIDCESCDGTGKYESCDDEICELVKCKTCDGKGKISSLVTKKEAQSMLEELRMRGVGNGIVEKLVDAFVSIGKFSSGMLKNTPYAVSGILEMLGYTALLLPIMNAIQYYIGNYDITLDNIKGNLLSLGLMTGSFIAKRGLNWLIRKFKDIFNLKIKDPEHDVYHNITSDIGKDIKGGDMIKEQ